jgi:hypothetical protein
MQELAARLRRLCEQAELADRDIVQCLLEVMGDHILALAANQEDALLAADCIAATLRNWLLRTEWGPASVQ